MPSPALVVGPTVAVAAAIAASALPHLHELDIPLVLWLVAFVILAEVGGVPLFERSSYSISAVPTIAAAVLLGTPGGVLVAIAGAVVRGLRRRTQAHKVLFNASVYVIASAGAATVFGISGVRLTPGDVAALMVVGGLAGLAYYCHTFAIAAAIASELRTPTMSVWTERFRWLVPHYLVLGAMSMLLALAYQAFGVVGAAAFVVPPLMMRSVAKHHLDRTLETVAQLNALNNQLRDEVARRTAAEAENAARYHEASEALRQRDQFLSVAAHELKTPVTSLWGFIQGLERQERRPGGVDRERLGYVLGRLDVQARKLGRLIDQLLDVSRLHGGLLNIECQPADLVQIVSDAVQAAQARTTLHELVLHAKGPVVGWVDPLRIENVLGTLLDNAIKYSPDGGQVEVEVEAGSDAIRLTVRDHGIGVALADQPRIFEQYYRAHEDSHRSGLGLGLHISRRIVEMHGGRIEVESPQDGGTRFVVTLPAGPTRPDAPGAA